VGRLKYANIGLAVGMVVLWGGAFLFRESEAAIQAITVFAFVVTFVVYRGLDERNRRRERSRRQ
jgi:4-hydroxybenzoate polyprenyltransferase